MHGQVGQDEFENPKEDQIMKDDNLDYSSVWEIFRSPRERNMGERQVEPSNPKNENH